MMIIYIIIVAAIFELSTGSVIYMFWLLLLFENSSVHKNEEMSIKNCHAIDRYPCCWDFLKSCFTNSFP